MKQAWCPSPPVQLLWAEVWECCRSWEGGDFPPEYLGFHVMLLGTTPVLIAGTQLPWVVWLQDFPVSLLALAGGWL